MGADVSCLPQPSSNLPYFTLTFRAPDRIGLILADNFAIETIRRAVMHHWRQGIQFEGPSHDGSYQIKLNGNAFSMMEAMEMGLQSNHLCCKMFSDLRYGGWKLVLTSDLSKSEALSTLFFQKSPTMNMPQHVFCISLTGQDKLHLAGAPENMKWVLRDAVMAGYGLGIQQEGGYGPDYVIKLRGDPWKSKTIHENLCGRKLILEIFRRFDMSNYKFYGRANLKETADSIFFKNADYGQPVGGQYMMVSLNGNDLLVLVDCPHHIITAVRDCIIRYWLHGIQGERDVGIAWEFKLRGNPWWASGPETVSCRYLLSMIFQVLLSIGWSLVSSLDVDRRCTDKSVFVFKNCQPMNLPHCCISLNESDKIRLINPSPDLPGIFRNAILSSWPFGIRGESHFFNSYQFHLVGNPWWSPYLTKDYLAAGYMMLCLLKALNHNGWTVICSADVSAKFDQNQNTSDVDSWFAVCTGTQSYY